VYKARLESEEQVKDIEEARSAIAAAPEFGLAHALLASGLANRTRIGGKALDEAAIREIQHHLQKAMQVDGDNPEVLAHLSATQMHLGDAEAGLSLARRAAQLDPYSVPTQFALALAYFSLGRLSETIDVVTRVDHTVSLDAISYGTGTLSLLGICLFMEGRDEEAEAAVDRALAYAPNFYVSLRWKAILAAARGRDRAARVAISQLRRAEPGRSIEQYLRSPKQLPFEHPRKDEAIAILRRLLEATEGEA
jgi:tetratricopeptide (TPR) repeat protein